MFAPFSLCHLAPGREQFAGLVSTFGRTLRQLVIVSGPRCSIAFVGASFDVQDGYLSLQDSLTDPPIKSRMQQTPDGILRTRRKKNHQSHLRSDVGPLRLRRD